MTKLSADEANAFLRTTFKGEGTRSEVVAMTPGRAVVKLAANDTHLRPGGFISGPTQMSLCDTAAYMAIMTLTGLEPMAVTSHLSINFLRPCIGKTVLAEGRILKIGQTLAVIEVDVRIENAEKPASHAVVTYALPRRDPAGA